MSTPITEGHLRLANQIVASPPSPLVIATLIADSEARACATVAQWHPASVSPKPSFEGVLCEAYLAITLDAERPCVLTYIYANRQWTQGEGDTQRIKCWGRITPRDWTVERDQLRAARDECERQFQDKVQRLGEEVEVTNQLRAEVERLKRATTNGQVNWMQESERQNARAERAEASLHALRLVCGTTDAEKFSTWVDRANARAEKAEAELAAEQARLDWLLSRMAGLVLPANKCVAWTVDVYDYENRFPSRAAIDSAMKEGK